MTRDDDLLRALPLEEDIAICERVQAGLLSGSYVGGSLSPRRNAGVWHFQNLLRQAYRCS
jgi:choline monooxygenase